MATISMPGLPLSVAARVARIVPMLSTDRDGERLAAVAAIERVLRSAGRDWHDLAAHLEEVPAPYFAPPPPRSEPKQAHRKPKPQPKATEPEMLSWATLDDVMRLAWLLTGMEGAWLWARRELREELHALVKSMQRGEPVAPSGEIIAVIDAFLAAAPGNNAKPQTAAARWFASRWGCT